MPAGMANSPSTRDPLSLNSRAGNAETAIPSSSVNDTEAIPPLNRASQLVYDYLIKREPAFATVTEYRNRGWQNKVEGDAVFKAQRERSDQANGQDEKRFFDMMQQIAEEMQRATKVLTPSLSHNNTMKILDICMAPGGYTAAALKYNPRAEAYGISLPTKLGGHQLLLDRNLLVGFREYDITLLTKEFMNDSTEVSSDHPDRQNFISVRPFNSHKFDLIFCDGAVLRTHSRASYREKNEARRLNCAQLVLAMQRIVSGGTLVMLLHKIDHWASATLLHAFSKFSKLEVFKPVAKHGPRSSFYMIAKDVDVEDPMAKEAVQKWKDMWYEATFVGLDGCGGDADDPADEEVLQMIEDFGEELIRLGKDVWRIQAEALARTPWAGVAATQPSRVSLKTKENIPFDPRPSPQ